MIRLLLNLFASKKSTNDPAEVERRTKGLTNLGSVHAFRLFRDPKFREMMMFGKIDEEEQNRIFNELVVTNLMILMLMLDQRIREAEGRLKQYLQALREAVPKVFIQELFSMGIPKGFVDIWQKLVDLRYEEYEKSTLEVRGEFLNHDDPEMREFALENRLMAFQAIAVGSCYHLVRGNADRGIELYRTLYRKYLLRVAHGLLRKL